MTEVDIGEELEESLQREKKLRQENGELKAAVSALITEKAKLKVLVDELQEESNTQQDQLGGINQLLIACNGGLVSPYVQAKIKAILDKSDD